MSFNQLINVVTTFCYQLPNNGSCLDLEWKKPLSQMLDTICSIRECSFTKLNETTQKLCSLVCEEGKFKAILENTIRFHSLTVKKPSFSPKIREGALALKNAASFIGKSKEYAVDQLIKLSEQIKESSTLFQTEILSDGQGLIKSAATFLDTNNQTEIMTIALTSAGISASTLESPLENIDFPENGVAEIKAIAGIVMPSEPLWKAAHTVGLVTLAVLAVATGTLALTCYRKLQAKEIT